MGKFNLLRTRRFAAAGTRQAASGAFETRFAIPFAAAGAASPRPGRGDAVATACARLWRRRPSDDRRRTTFSKSTDALSNARARARAWGPSEILSRRRGPARARHRGEDAPAGRPRRSPRKATAGEEVSTGQEGTAAAEPARPSRAVVTGSGGGVVGGSPGAPRRPGRGRGSTRPCLRAMHFGIWKCQNIVQISFHFLLARE